MSAKKFIWLTVGLIALFLLVRGAEAYGPALKTITSTFSSIYLSLVNPKGK